ncbi:MAG TPA: FtsQ-type POTRA domain-containing protein [Rubrobacteraceae bacterium]|nr:FtsQ-type POTRA domain-containing protein [Rubrobacteraceae bacterium]
MRLYPFNLILAIGISTAVATLTALIALTVSYLLYPVAGIEVHGARMLPESVAWEGLPGYASLPSLNSSTLEREIEANPWVKGVKVLKDWESGIVTVEVEERKAVLDGDLGGRRIVLAADGTELPGLGGATLTRLGLDEAQLEEILAVGEVLDKNGVMLDSIDMVGAEGIETTVEGYRVLFADFVGDEQAQALESLIEEHPDAAYFDLRSPDRVVVGPESSGG